MVLSVFPFQLDWSCCFCHLHPVVCFNISWSVWIKNWFFILLFFVTFSQGVLQQFSAVTNISGNCVSPAIMSILIKTVFVPA